MLSKYFQLKTKTKKFDDDLLWSMGEIKGKRVILLGAGEDFVELNQRYFFKDVLNIVAIADKKFETEPVETFEGIRAITPNQIKNEDYDVILITNEDPTPILDFVFNDLCIENKDIRTIFNEEIQEEHENLNYLFQYNFDKTLPRLIKKLKGTKIKIKPLVKKDFWTLVKEIWN